LPISKNYDRHEEIEERRKSVAMRGNTRIGCEAFSEPQFSQVNVGLTDLAPDTLTSSSPTRFVADFSQSNWDMAMREIKETIMDSIKGRRYADATGDMKRAIFSSSRILAETFEKTIEQPFLVPHLIQELKDNEVITDEEYNRLTVLLMALDGLNVEVSEYGGELQQEDLDYFLEYCQIIQQILFRNGMQILLDSKPGWSSHDVTIADGDTAMNQRLTSVGTIYSNFTAFITESWTNSRIAQ
jgi:hypothetical protein